MNTHTTVHGKMKLTLFLQILISVLFILYTILMLAYQNYSDLSNRYYQAGERMLTLVENVMDRLDEANLFPAQDARLPRVLRDESLNNNYRQYQYFELIGRPYVSLQNAELIALYDLMGNGVSIQYGKSDYRLSRITDEAEWYAEMKSVSNAIPRLVSAQDLRGTGMPDIDSNYLCSARCILDVSTFKVVGVCMAGIRTETLENMFRTLRYSPGQTFALYWQDQLLYCSESKGSAVFPDYQQGWETLPKQSEQQKQIVRVGGVLYLINTMRHTDGCSIVLCTPLSDMTGQMQKLQLTFTVVVSLILIIMVGLIAGNIHDVMQAMNRLVEACDEFELERQVQIPNNDMPREIRILFESFNRMSGRIHALVEEVLKKQHEQQETEMQLLRTQINPHYLYNTLEMIHMRAYLQKNTDVADMAELLGKNLQYGLRNTNRVVTLREELEQVQIYLKILSYQYKNRIQTNLFIDPDLMDCMVIKLLFQPIIENSVIHGIESADQVLHIDIIGYREGNAIVFQISDDGCGIEPNKLEELQASIRDQNSSGIGFRNVCRRILLRYGDQYHAQILSEKNMGSTVTLYLPYRKNTEGEEKTGYDESSADR